MASQLEKLQEAIDSRVMRERALLFLVLLAFVFMVWNFLLQAPLDNERKKAQTELGSIATERKNVEGQITSLTMAAANSPIVAKRKEIAQLKQQIQDVETKLAAMSQGLISADQLPQMLEAMLKEVGELELISIQTLPASELKLVRPVTDVPSVVVVEGSKAEQDTGVYKHVVVVRIAGGYFQLLELLDSLQSLSWKFYWEALNYQVDGYPQAEIELRVFTLSSEEGLLGV